MEKYLASNKVKRYSKKLAPDAGSQSVKKPHILTYEYKTVSPWVFYSTNSVYKLFDGGRAIDL